MRALVVRNCHECPSHRIRWIDDDSCYYCVKNAKNCPNNGIGTPDWCQLCEHNDNRIYSFDWYTMDGIYVIVQAPNEKEAIEIVKEYVKRMYNTTIEELQLKYGKYEVKDLTNMPVIKCGKI